MSDKATDRTAKIIALLREKVRLEPWHRRLFYIVFGVLWGRSEGKPSVRLHDDRAERRAGAIRLAALLRER